ncbi:MAG: hypothetical protein COX48_04475 [bacterium (Candidatus Stahlbacteria) CG23_combo_of_CG06-09_8_20_14_all_34_7]|nr:MAG: hypothetical protein COX48_04475 [bacterium (Candidatus Stahlbacteria) CG23_combo_of_CG06-09_8_20_14_all_34_7]
MISIIIINYNGTKFASKLIESLNSQSIKYDEAVIIDNNSLDKSEKTFLEKLKHVTLCKFIKNKGFSSAVNIGIKAALYNNVLLLNNDTYLKTDFIENCLKNLNKYNNTFFAPLVLTYDGKRIDSAGDKIDRGFRPTKRMSGEKYNGNLKGEKIDGFSMSVAYFRKNDFMKIGPLDERFFMYFEDADFSLRAKEAGYDILFTPDCIAYHYISAYTKSKYKSSYSPQKVYWEGRNRVWMFIKSKYKHNIFKVIEFIYGTITSFIFHLLKTMYFAEYANGVFFAFRGSKKL